MIVLSSKEFNELRIVFCSICSCDDCKFTDRKINGCVLFGTFFRYYGDTYTVGENFFNIVKENKMFAENERLLGIIRKLTHKVATMA